MPTTAVPRYNRATSNHGRAKIAGAVLIVLAGLTYRAPAFAAERLVVIGAMYNLTGGQQELDVPSSRGTKLAVDEMNKAGGVLGRKVALVLVDGHTKPKVIAREAAKLIKQQPALSGLIGFSDTDMVLAAAPIAARDKRVFLTSGATSPELPRRVPRYLFLVCFGDNVQAAAGAEWAVKVLKTRNVVVLYKQTAARGLPKADLVYFAAQPDDVLAGVAALRGAGITAPILGGDGLDIGEAWQQAAQTSNVYFTTHAYLGADNPDPRVQAFRRLFAKAYPGQRPDAFSALGYDAARLLMAAIKSAGSTNPQAVRKALAATHDFAGVTGTISYRDGSRIPAKSVSVIAVTQGRQLLAASLLPEKIPAP
jgi:branched-chain amino acid transport system substrate-binding protein